MAGNLILAIDDQAENLKYLDRILKHANYHVAVAIDAKNALSFLERKQPDLILCDIIMPEIDGYMLCKQLKNSGLLEEVPLIFLTARTEPEALLKGFEAGAVDYVTKPFHPEELLARVQTHLELKMARDTIVSYNHRLEELNEEKNQFLNIAAHDLRNPLASIMLSAEMVETRFQRLSGPRTIKYVNGIYNDAERMLTIVSNLLDVHRIESGNTSPEKREFDLSLLLHKVNNTFSASAEKKQIEIKTDIPLNVTYNGDSDLLSQMLENLISNALKYAKPQTQIQLCLQQTPLRIHIQDEGPGFSTEDLGKLFQKFAKLSARPTQGETSTGLGLSIVKKLSQLMDIQVRCVSQPGESAHFVIDLSVPYAV